MPETTITCAGCEVEFAYDPDTGETVDPRMDRDVVLREPTAPWADDTEEFCDECETSDLEHGATVVRYDHEGHVAVRFGDHFADSTEGEPPDWFGEHFTKPTWVSTDAWRGYTRIETKGLVTAVEGGWVTGMPDETVAHKRPLLTLAEVLEGHTPPVPVYVALGVTSNVFSQTFDLYVESTDDLDTLNEWLAEFGLSLGVLDEATR